MIRHKALARDIALSARAFGAKRREGNVKDAIAERAAASRGQITDDAAALARSKGIALCTKQESPNGNYADLAFAPRNFSKQALDVVRLSQR
jgi:hypothetical protein